MGPNESCQLYWRTATFRMQEIFANFTIVVRFAKREFASHKMSMGQINENCENVLLYRIILASL